MKVWDHKGAAPGGRAGREPGRQAGDGRGLEGQGLVLGEGLGEVRTLVLG